MESQSFCAGGWKGFLGKGLAPRELEATVYAACELTVKEIGRAMGISPKTAEKRLEDARFKLGVKSIRGLVIEAFKRQIITPVAVGMVALVCAHSVFGDDPGMRNRRMGERRIELRQGGRRAEDIQFSA